MISPTNFSSLQVREDGVVEPWFDHCHPVFRTPIKGESFLGQPAQLCAQRESLSCAPNSLLLLIATHIIMTLFSCREYTFQCAIEWSSLRSSISS